LRVEVVAEGGGAPQELRAVLASQSGPIVTITCPGDSAAASLQCLAGGLAIDASAVPADLTLKAPGCAFPTLALAADATDRVFRWTPTRVVRQVRFEGWAPLLV